MRRRDDVIGSTIPFQSVRSSMARKARETERAKLIFRKIERAISKFLRNEKFRNSRHFLIRGMRRRVFGTRPRASARVNVEGIFHQHQPSATMADDDAVSASDRAFRQSLVAVRIARFQSEWTDLGNRATLV